MLVGLFAGSYAVPRPSGLHLRTFHTTFSENMLTGSVKTDKCGQRVALVSILLSLGRKICQQLIAGTVPERLLYLPCPVLCLSPLCF